MEQKEVQNMYTMTIIRGIAIVAYFLFYSIDAKRRKAPLELEDNYLAFYVSANKHNKAYKLLIGLFDLLSFAGTIVIDSVISANVFLNHIRDSYELECYSFLWFIESFIKLC